MKRKQNSYNVKVYGLLFTLIGILIAVGAGTGCDLVTAVDQLDPSEDNVQEGYIVEKDESRIVDDYAILHAYINILFTSGGRTTL